MPAEKKFTSYGLREVQLAPIISDTTEGTEYATELVRVWGAKTANLKPEISTNQLTGDDGVVEISSNVVGGTVGWEHGVMTLKGIQAVLGGSIADIVGEDGQATIGQKYTVKNAQELPYFGVIAKTESGGTMLVAAYKCKATSLELEFTEEDYCIVKVEGSLLRRESDEELFSISKYDATKAITVEDIK